MGLGLVRIAGIVLFSWAMSASIVGVFLGGRTLRDVLPLLGLAATAILARAAASWGSDVFASVAATRTKSELRARVTAAACELGPGWLGGRSSAAIATTATHGLDALDSYFSAFLPQLVLTAIATPVFLVLIWSQDWISGIAVAVTMPVIPVFMVLIGFFTQDVQKKQWSALTILSGHFLDVVRGLSTLKIFRRERFQIGVIARVTADYRERTMKVLRVSFLSGFVLELGATLAVAIVAVLIGTRLISGQLDLATGLFVLLITPEAFLPLRQVGANYHAAAEGAVAADEVFEILDAAAASRTRGDDGARRASRTTPALTASGGREARDLLGGLGIRRIDGVRARGLSITYDDAVHPAVDGVRFEADRGCITAIVGPSGSGKSSVFAALLGFVPYRGELAVLIAGEQAGWDGGLCAWSGQRPGLRDGSIAENVAIGDAVADPAVVAEALRLAAIRLDPSLRLGPDGDGLSGGQAQRVSLARAYYRAIRRGASVLLLDEPTSALDAETEEAVIAGWRLLADAGAIVLVITHRQAIMDQADSVVAIGDPARRAMDGAQDG